MTTAAFDNILTRLESVKGNGASYQARCPAHDDRVASLSISRGEDGRALVHCHAGCSTEAVLQAVGLRMADLFPARQGTGDGGGGSRKAATYDYTDAAGELLYQVVRFEPKSFRQRRPNGRGGWIWNLKDTEKVIYRLPKVVEAVARGETIYVVEGEKDTHTLEGLGLTATCNAGGACAWQKCCSKWLKGADVIIVPDNDTAGGKHAEKVAASLSGVAASVKVLVLPGLPEKGDVTDWLAAGGTKDRLLDLAAACPEWEPEAEPVSLPGSVGGFPLTDLGNAERLIARHGADLRYDVDSGVWLAWTGKLWQPDVTGRVDRLAREVVRGLYDLLKDCTDSRERDDLYGHIKRSESDTRLGAMVKLAKFCSGVPVQSKDLDRDPWALNVLNGTLDLRTGELHPHRREDLITKLAPVEHDERAACPRWERFLSEIFAGDGELISFVQRAAGYSLTGDTSEQCFFMLHGNGSNGKSTMLTALREILADYHRKAGTDTLINRDESASNDIARLRGARMVSAIEASPGRKLAEALVKELTGGDAMRARFLYQEFFEFVPEFKLWLACNHLPHIDGQEYAMWRRIRLIPFKVQFQDADAPTGPYKDMMLPDKLRMEYPGILAWLVRGCLAWQSEGLGTARAVKAATGKYREDMDVLADFFAECCVIHPDAKAKSSVLYATYSEWAKGRGEKYPLAGRTFSQRLEERGTFEKRVWGQGKFWLGIGLLDGDFERENPDQVTEVTEVTPKTGNFPMKGVQKKFTENGVTSVTSVTNEPGAERENDVPEDYEPGFEALAAPG